MKVSIKLDKPPAEILHKAAIKYEPLAENRAGTIARALVHKKVCVVLGDSVFECGAFNSQHISREYNTVHKSVIGPVDKIPEVMFDGCMTLTNTDVFMRMLSPGNQGYAEDEHGRKISVHMELRKDLIAIDGFEHMEAGKFDKLKELLSAFRTKSPYTVIVASAAIKDAVALRQLDLLFDTGIIDHIESPKSGENYVCQLDLICRGAMLLEKRLAPETGTGTVNAHADPNDVHETVIVEPAMGG